MSRIWDGSMPVVDRIVGTAVFVLCLLLATATAAYAHELGFDSIDGDELVWDESTKYDAARKDALSSWQSLTSVDIRPDDAWSYEDLEFKDFSSSRTTRIGYLDPSPGSDELFLNTYYLDSMARVDAAAGKDCYGGTLSALRRAVANHEFGHAMGLAHSEYSSTIMKADVCDQGTRDGPGYHDAKDLDRMGIGD